MPRGVKYQGKYQAARRYGAPARGGPRWGLIPLTAALVLAAVVLLTRTGLGHRLEAAVTAAAQNETLAQNIIRLVLPEGASAGDAPLPDPEPEPEPATQPFWHETAPQDSDENLEGALLSPEEALLYLPEPLAYESVLPGPDPGAGAASPVSALTISGPEGGYEGSGTVYMRNETRFDIDLAALLKRKSPVKLSGDGVQVLIMHTHGTEAYTPDAAHPYTPTDTDRTLDADRNVTRVGREVARILNEKGIKTLHSVTLNDYPAYSGSYNRALEDITRYVKENPSIKVVIDIHRDAMVSQSGVKYKTVADIDGQSAAQLMLVAGTDQGGLKHDSWQSNLAFQLKVQDRMNTRYPGIMRPINIRTGRFNQHVTLGSMLLEVGTSGNSLGEALLSAQLFAQELAGLLTGK